jgi:hypothetical protein
MLELSLKISHYRFYIILNRHYNDSTIGVEIPKALLNKEEKTLRSLGRRRKKMMDKKKLGV